VAGFKFLLDEGSYKGKLPHLFRWFEAVSALEAFTKAWGKVRLCSKPFLKFEDGKDKKDKKEKVDDKIEEKKGKEEKSKAKNAKAEKQPDDKTTKGDPKTEKVKDTVPKKINEKKGKEDEEDNDEALFEKKEKNPLDSLPPSSFNFFDFKTLFVNA